VLQEREVKRVGANEVRGVDVRVIAATNQNLSDLVKSGAFREDLYFRLNVFPIQTPPLRERRDDVAPLAYYFLRQQTERQERDIKRVAMDAMTALQNHHWTGNVRELENVITRAVVMESSDTLRLNSLPQPLQALANQRPGSIPPPGAAAIAGAVNTDLPYADARKHSIDRFERRYFTELLRKTRGNKAAAARLAGMDRANFRRSLKRVGLAESTHD
jgi:DNA-binding NtrC family response regulator